MSDADSTLADLRAAAAHLGFTMSDDALREYEDVVDAAFEGFEALDAVPDDLPPVRYPRGPGRKPKPADNPLGAWQVLEEIPGANSGPLMGRRVAIKDNVMVAGLPIEMGTPFFEGYLPPMDATVVTRTLDAGATITGKSVCEFLCLSGGSHTSHPGPVRNPYNRDHVAGGSSSGSAALVAAGEVDMAIGGDQGGSIRAPASACGVVGMKPTHGLIPYTGALPLLTDADHLGPMTANVADNALFLEVLAGPDGHDERQHSADVKAYREGLDAGVRGLRVGVLEEAFGIEGQMPEIEAKVRSAAATLEKLGATVRGVSAPLHPLSGAIGFGTMQAMVSDPFFAGGFGLNSANLQVPCFVDRTRDIWERANEFPSNVKAILLATEVAKKRAGFRYLAKARNLRRALRADYDRLLSDVDLLLLPTSPITAPRIPEPGASVLEIYSAAYTILTHTFAFNLTQHPALSVPCGLVDGLPVGLMLVGRHWDEPTLYRAGYAFEQAGDWRAR